MEQGTRPSSNMRVKARVLIVDDERILLNALTRALSREFDVVAEGDGRRAVERLIRGEHFDVVLCDVMMPELSGLDVYERVRAVSTETASRFVFVTGGVVVPFMRAFLERLPNVCLEKPIDMEGLRALLRERTRRESADPGVSPGD